MLDGSGKCSKGLIVALALLERHRKIVMRECERRIEFDRLFVGLDRAVRHAHAAKQIADAGVSFGTIGIDRESRLIARKRFLLAAEARKGERHVEQRIRRIRVCECGAAVDVDGFLVSPLRTEIVAELVQGLGDRFRTFYLRRKRRFDFVYRT